MPTKPLEKTSSILSRIRSSSDDFMNQVIELDTLANGARSVLRELPYFSRLPGQFGCVTLREQAEDIEARRNYDRLQLLVFATAEACERLMDIAEAADDDDEELADEADEADEAEADDDGDDGSSSGRAGNGGPGDSGGPGGSGSPARPSRGTRGTLPR